MADEGITQAKAPTRRELVFEGCNTLAAKGLKPSLRLVRSLDVRGSDTDVQADVNAWFDQVLKGYSLSLKEDSIPALLRNTLTALWSQALSEATDTFSVKRTEWQQQIHDLENALKDSANSLQLERDGRIHAENLAEGLQKSLTQKTNENGSLAVLSSTLKQKVEDLEIQNRAQANSTQALIVKHEKALDDLARETRAQIDGLEKRHRADTKLNQEQHEARIHEMKTQMELAESRYRALEERSLRELDTMRVHVSNVTSAHAKLGQELKEVQKLLKEEQLKSARHEIELRMKTDSLEQANKELASCRKDNHKAGIAAGRLQEKIDQMQKDLRSLKSSGKPPKKIP